MIDGDGLAVESEGLGKAFRNKKVVGDLSLAVPRGAVYGFLGPNGSGKTTTIRMLLGLIRPTEGSVRVLGERITHASNAVLHRVGSLVEGPAFHPYLSGRANLARLDAGDARADASTAAQRIDAALDRVGLLGAATKKFRIYSLGMKQRLAIAACLLQPRDLLILDEPTNGLDPQGTREVRHLVGSLADDGTTVLVSSHLLSEVEQMCSHLGVMSVGSLVAQGPIDDLRAQLAGSVVLVTSEPARAVSVFEDAGFEVVNADGDEVSASGGVPVADLVPRLVAAEVPVTSITTRRPSLEDLFVTLTGEGFDIRG